jgi:phosphoribosylamine-glycine ligase
MSLKSLADEAMTQISKAVSNPLTKEEADTVSRIIQHSLIKAVNQAAEKCTTAAVVCCGPEADLAHKIAEEAERAEIALIANLTSMR